MLILENKAAESSRYDPVSLGQVVNFHERVERASPAFRSGASDLQQPGQRPYFRRLLKTGEERERGKRARRGRERETGTDRKRGR